MHTTDESLRDARRRRRRHGEDFKAHVVAECARPEVSIAAIALRHELNANLLRRWVAQAGAIDGEERQEDRPTNTGLETFVPVAIAPHAATEPATIEVEIERGALAVRINWPVSAASQCGAWLRELLR